MFCWSLYVLLYFFSLCCLFVFDIRILIASLWYLQTLPALFLRLYCWLCSPEELATKNLIETLVVSTNIQFANEFCISDNSYICTDIIQRKSLKIPKGGNQNPYIKDEQTTQREKVQKDLQRPTKHYLKNMFNCWNRHYNDQKNKGKRTNNDLQNTARKLKF
jgi:hypothetical protein